jgi:hypothetical protein
LVYTISTSRKKEVKLMTPIKYFAAPELILLKIAQLYRYLLIKNPQFGLRRARSFIQNNQLPPLIEPRPPHSSGQF